MLRRIALVAAISASFLLIAAPVWGCAALIGRNGAVNLVRTTTLAAYSDGVEHYVTSFEFAGGGGEFGSIVPLPGVPTKVEKAGAWTLQRLIRETQPQPAFEALAVRAASAQSSKARIILETRIDALDITILEGGAFAVGEWAKEHEFILSPDTPEVLDFYARRSPIFMAARFDADAARSRGQDLGDGTPIHLTIPVSNPWVPLRILGLGKKPAELVTADVYLLTDTKPALLPEPGEGLELLVSRAASSSLLNDLRSDKGMSWIPRSMWLTQVGINTSAGELEYDLAIDTSGKNSPSPIAAGLVIPNLGAPVPALQDRSDTATKALMGVSLGLAVVFGTMALAAMRSSS